MKRILILGAGFAGIEAAIHLQKLLGGSPEYEICLINEHNYFLFTPLLPQIPSSYINPRHIVQPVRDIRGSRNFQFRRDDVRAIDCVAPVVIDHGAIAARNIAHLERGAPLQAGRLQRTGAGGPGLDARLDFSPRRFHHPPPPPLNKSHRVKE